MTRAHENRFFRILLFIVSIEAIFLKDTKQPDGFEPVVWWLGQSWCDQNDSLGGKKKCNLQTMNLMNS